MKGKFSLISIACIFFFISLIRFDDKNWGVDGHNGVLAWDNFGYYLYLPAVFIYDDLKLEKSEWIIDVREKYNPSPSFYQAHYVEGGTHVIQYTMGMAIIYTPAFLLAHAYASFSDTYPADGFSLPYQFSILLYALLIILLGLFFLRKICLYFFNDRLASILIITICLGKQLLLEL